MADGRRRLLARSPLPLRPRPLSRRRQPAPVSPTRRALALIRLTIWAILALVLILLAGLQSRAEQRAGIDLASPRLPPTQAAQQIPFAGVTVEMAGLSPAQRQADLARLRAAGFGWVRQRLDWQELEPEPGRFQWAAADDLVATLVASGLTPILVLDGSPAWARAAQDRGENDNPLAPPADPASFARFAAAVVARYGGRYGDRVTFYQVWDEPNVAPHWGNRLIDPVGYARLLAEASPAMRAANPDVVILLAALAPTLDRGHTAMDEIYFLERIYAAGAAPHFDAVAVQPFGFGLPPAHPPDPKILDFRRAELVRRVMVAAGDGAKPVWAVRSGWNRRLFSPWGAVSEANQIQFAQEANALAWESWPWLAALGWAIDRPAAPPRDPVWGFALVDETGVPTPLFTGLAEAVPTAPRPQPSTSGGGERWRWWLLIVAGAVVAQRSWAAARLLPWTAWGAAWMRRPAWVRAGAWGLLAGVYFFATWPPLIALIWGVAALGFLADPRQGARLGLGLAVALLPFHSYHKEVVLVQAVLTVPPAYAALLTALPAVVVDWRRQRAQQGRQEFSFTATDWLALAWLGLGGLGAVQGWPWPAYAAGLTQTVLMPVLFYAGVRSLAVNMQNRRMVLGAAALGAALAAGLGLWSWADGGGTVVDGLRRLTAPTFSPNHTALYLERSLFVAIGLVALTRRRRWLWAGTGIILGLALALTASRGAWLLGIPAGAVTLGLLGRQSAAGVSRRHVRRLLAWGGGIGLAGGIGLFWLWGDRLTNSATVIGRLYVWQGSLALWLDHLWLGIGPGRFFWRYPAYLLLQVANEPNLLHPHNLWLEAATGGGILGLGWLVAALVIGLGLIRRQDPASSPGWLWLRAALAAGLVAGLAHAQVDAFAALPDLAAWNWVALGILAAWRDQKSGPP